jgi:hypothetical protein
MALQPGIQIYEGCPLQLVVAITPVRVANDPENA